jgi:hypothetical protein
MPKAGAQAKPGAEAKRANENAASRLIDERIRSLGDWRGRRPKRAMQRRPPWKEKPAEIRVCILQDVYRIGGDVDLKLLETFEEGSLQADKELPVGLRVWRVYEQADEVLLIPLSFVHPDTTHGGG